VPVETLEESRVLAVNGQEQPSSPLPGGDREISCRDETLLVRERERHAPLERPQCCADAREAHDGIQDEVGLGCVEKIREIAPDADVLDAETSREVAEGPRPGCESADRKLRSGRNHLERLQPDGSGRPEQGDSSLAHGRRLTALVFRHGYALPNARIVK
jgi:hypothetical protein